METVEALCLVFTTWPADQAVDVVATVLVDEGLAACVSVGAAMTSVYRWEGRIERSEERQVVVKTTRGRVEALERRLRGLHPYAVPEFLILDVEASAHYGAWLRDAVGGRSGR